MQILTACVQQSVPQTPMPEYSMALHSCYISRGGIGLEMSLGQRLSEIFQLLIARVFYQFLCCDVCIRVERTTCDILSISHSHLMDAARTTELEIV